LTDAVIVVNMPALNEPWNNVAAKVVLARGERIDEQGSSQDRHIEYIRANPWAARSRYVSAVRYMKFQELTVVHFVNMIGFEDQNVVGLVQLEEANTLENRAGCAFVSRAGVGKDTGQNCRSTLANRDIARLTNADSR